jgi:hypothetical protein
LDLVVGEVFGIAKEIDEEYSASETWRPDPRSAPAPGADGLRLARRESSASARAAEMASATMAAVRMAPGKYAQEITKTGFELEFRVSEVLRQVGWTVIANKYYLDDHQDTVREIDLIAYRTTKLPDFRVATIIVVSCKKNEKDAWVLLARDVDRRDPNMEWQPIHTWSNDKVLKHILGPAEWRTEYPEFVAKRGCGDLHQVPNRHIFAFQEMNRVSGKPNNDRNIFESITSLMKAQAYELSALPQRTRSRSVYQFNLLSVIETDLVRLDFSSNGDIAETEVEEETYVARYIIAKRQTFARIHIVRFAALLKALNRYNALHEANAAFFEGLNKRAYEDAVKNGDRAELFWKEFIERLSAMIRWRYKFGEELALMAVNGSMSWSDENKEVRIHIAVGAEQVETLNAHAELRQRLTELLKSFYRYEGKSRFDVSDDIPF